MSHDGSGLLLGGGFNFCQKELAMRNKMLFALAGMLVVAGLAAAQVPEAAPVEWQAPTLGMASDGPAVPRVWLGTEYLLWWSKNGPAAPPLLTASTTPASATAGNIGAPGTVILLGNQNMDYGAASGLRVNAGGWLNQDRTLGVESSCVPAPAAVREARRTCQRAATRRSCFSRSSSWAAGSPRSS